MRQPDKRLWQTLGAIGAQIGQFLGRAEAERAVRESEARFRALTNLSTDWYWELDAQYRFTRLEGRNVAGGDPDLQRRLIGQARWDTGLEIEGGWDAHRALLEARQPFHDVLMWRPMADGRVRYMRVSGEPLLNTDGSFAGYRGIGRDVTDEKRAEQMLRLEHDVARLLAAAEDAAAGLKAVMRAVCEAEGFACGRYFRVDGELLRFHDAWAIGDPSIAPFVERSRSFVFRPGEGLTGIVFRSGEPVWSPDITRDARVRDRKVWEGTGLRGGFVFPVVTEGRTVGVLNFSSLRAREPDQRLLAASRVIGSQIGQFMQRKSAEASLRDSEARFRSLTQMSSDFFWETDEAHRFTQLVHGPGYLSAEMGRGVVGKAAWELPCESPDDAGWAAQRERLDRHEPFRDFEFARRMPDGVVRVLSISGDPRFGAQGAFLGYRGVGPRRHRDRACARAHRFARLQRPAHRPRQPHQPDARARPGGAARAAQERQARGGVHGSRRVQGDQRCLRARCRRRAAHRARRPPARQPALERPDRAPRRRRVPGGAGGGAGSGAGRDRGEEAPGRDGAALLPARRAGQRHREHRHQYFPGRRGRRHRPHEARRHGDVRREAGGQELLPVLFVGAGGQ